jgi:hypothetical protein
MAYTVDYTDGTKTAILVNDGTVDTTTDLKLIGKNYSRYGEVVAEDFLHLLENFAAGTAPSRPSEGQLWYDSTNNCMKYFDDTQGNSGNWKGVGSMTVQSAAPNGVGETDGHMWLDSDNGQLYMYYNGAWQTVSSPLGTTQFVARTRIDTANASHSTLEMIVNGEIVSIVSSDAADWAPNTAGATAEYLENGSTLLNTQFPTLKQGINMNNGSSYLFNGTATSAQYADLAERYEADQPIAYGTVVDLGGEKEVTTSSTECSSAVFGVVSTNPGLMLNSNAGTDDTHPYIALAGRVPCKVIGTTNKGDRLVTSSTPGHARAVSDGEDCTYQHIIGRALDAKINQEPGLIEIVVGVK